MKKILLFMVLFLISSNCFAVDWAPANRENTFFFDKDSVKYETLNIYSLRTKIHIDDYKDFISDMAIDCDFKKYRTRTKIIYDRYKEKNIHREFVQGTWEDIPKGSTCEYLYNQVCK